MDRRPIRVAALAVTALLAIAWSDARADEGAPADVAVPAAEQPAPGDVATAPPADTAAGSTEAQEPPAPEEPAAPPPAAEPTVPEVAVTPPEVVEQTVVEVQEVPGAGPAGPAAPASEESDLLVELPVPEQGAGEPPAAVDAKPLPTPLSAPIKPASSPGAPAPAGVRSTRTLLSDVARELTSLRAEIDDLERLLEAGLAPSAGRLIRLRSRLALLTPVLLALEARLEAAGKLSPAMQELLRRVRVRLSSARVSTSGLISTLHHSGVRGPELRLLLDQLERFRAAGAGLAATLAAQQQPPEPFAGGPYLQPPAAPRAYTLAPPAAHPATAAGGTTERTHGGGSDPPRPWSPAPSSASAGPGVAFFAGGLALLAALLVGLSAGGPGQRLRLLPGRRYMALVPLPLERPG